MAPLPCPESTHTEQKYDKKDEPSVTARRFIFIKVVELGLGIFCQAKK
jgi:hypothetical protein